MASAVVAENRSDRGGLAAADLLGVEAVEIEIDHTPGRGWFRAGGQVEVRIREPYAGPET